MPIVDRAVADRDDPRLEAADRPDAQVRIGRAVRGTDAVGERSDADEVAAELRSGEGSGAGRQVPQCGTEPCRVRGIARRIEHRTGGIVVLVGRLRDVAPHPDDLDRSRLLELACAGHERRPLLGSHAVAVQPGVDLQVHARGGRGIRRRSCDVLEERGIADTDVESSRDRRCGLVGRADRPTRRSGHRARARSRTARPVLTSKAPNQRTPSRQARRTIGTRPCAYASSFTTSMWVAGATRSAMVRRLAENASRSTVRTLTRPTPGRSAVRRP